MHSHASRADLQAGQRNHERLESYLPRGVCLWCGTTYREGPEPVSHGVCTDPHCQLLQDAPLNEYRVLDMAWHARMQFGRLMVREALADAPSQRTEYER